MKDKTGTYELTRARVHMPLYPMPVLNDISKQPLSQSDSQAQPKPAQMYGATSNVSSIDEAEQRGDTLLAEFQRMERRRDLQALCKLLRDHPELVGNDEVRDTLLRWGPALRFRSGPGRPRSSFGFHSLVTMGLVEELVGRGRAKNRERAFAQLAEMNLATSYDAAKRAYYSAKSDSRFQAILIKTRSPQEDEIVEGFAERLHRSEMLRAGKPITRPIPTPWGAGQITFSAVENKAQTKA